MKIDPSKRYNARGERICVSCRRYLATDQFGRDRLMRDRLRPSCRACSTARGTIRRKQYLAANPAANERRAAKDNERMRRKRQEQQAAAQETATLLVRSLRQRGFTWEELEALTGVSRDCLTQHGKGGMVAYIQRRTVSRIERVLHAALDLPVCGEVKRGAHRPPHPDLGLVRARLDRMAYLAELEAAA